jgi:hypothetical protein
MTVVHNLDYIMDYHCTDHEVVVPYLSRKKQQIKHKKQTLN